MVLLADPILTSYDEAWILVSKSLFFYLYVGAVILIFLLLLKLALTKMSIWVFLFTFLLIPLSYFFYYEYMLNTPLAIEIFGSDEAYRLMFNLWLFIGLMSTVSITLLLILSMKIKIVYKQKSERVFGDL